MIDIVVPNGNEEQFAAQAKALGYSGLCFAYQFPNINGAAIALPKDVQKARRVSNLVLCRATDDARKIVEQAQPDIVYGLELGPKPDHTYYRNSGLNHVLAEIASRKGVMVAFSLWDIMASRQRHILLGRIMQNIMLCRKYHVETVIASFASRPEQMRNPIDMGSIFTVFGMTPADVKSSLNAAAVRISRNIERRQPDYAGEGIKVVKE